MGRGYSYDNTKVAAAIQKNGFCLVEVDGAPIGGYRHWVLYIGNQLMIDPWDGKEKATSSYKATGYSLIDKIGNPPQEQGGGEAPESSLLKKYGVASVEELDRKIEEHVGTTWGAEDKPGGGFLGSARRDITQLKKDLEVQTSMASDRQKWITELQDMLGLKTTDDIATVKAEINSLLVKEDDLIKANEKLEGIEKEHELETEALKKSLESQVEKLKEDYQKDLSEQLEQVKIDMDQKYGQRITTLEESLKQWEQAEQTTKIFHSIISLFKRKKS